MRHLSHPLVLCACFLRLAQFGVLVRSDTLILFEAADKVAAVVIAAGVGDICDRELVFFQKKAGSLYTIVV